VNSKKTKRVEVSTSVAWGATQRKRSPWLPRRRRSHEAYFPSFRRRILQRFGLGQSWYFPRRFYLAPGRSFYPLTKTAQSLEVDYQIPFPSSSDNAHFTMSHSTNFDGPNPPIIPTIPQTGSNIRPSDSPSVGYWNFADWKDGT